MWDDVACAWRRLRRTPEFATVALLTVMLTVGANAAILSIADAVLFRPLPFADPDNVAIIRIANHKNGSRSTRVDYEFLRAIDRAGPDLSEVALIEPFSGSVRPTVESADGRKAVPAMEATPNYFTLLGVQPWRGRVFAAADAGHEGRVAVLSFAAWRQLFARDEGVIGRTVTLGDATFDIVGVLPNGFVFPSSFAGRPSVIVMRAALESSEKGGTFHPIVRLARGVSRERAQAEVDAITAPVSAALPRAADLGPVLDDVRTVLYPVGRPIMRYLLAAAVLILVLGCANLANLMLVSVRRGVNDTAVRLALGASRSRLIRPLLFEALILSLGGAILALILTSLAFDALLRLVPPAAYGRAPVGVDARVIAISLAMGALCGLAFSLAPAWRASGADVQALIRRGGGHAARVRIGRPLVAAQVAIAIAVVFGAAIAGRAFVSVLRTPLGFSADRVLLVSIAAPRGATAADSQAFYANVIDVLTRRPDVAVAGAVGTLPFSQQAPDEAAIPTGATRPVAGIVHMLPGYLEAAGVSVRRGRAISWDDVRAGADVAVVSDAAARALFGDQEAIGGVFSNGRGREFRVVGVVNDVVDSLSGTPANRQAYVIPGSSTRGLTVVARMRARSDASVAAIRIDLRTTTGLAPSFEWWADLIDADNAFRNPRFQTIVLGGLAALALTLTALGTFSVIAYLVAARTHEMGVRLAIGASSTSLVGLIVRQSIGPVAVGLVAGIGLMWWGKTLAEAQLFAVATDDPVVAVAAAGTVVAAALAAAYIPARRVTRINPTDVLRTD